MQNKTREHNARHSQCKTCTRSKQSGGQEKTATGVAQENKRKDKTRQDKTRKDKTRKYKNDKKRQGTKREVKTRQHKTRHDMKPKNMGVIPFGLRLQTNYLHL